MRRRVPLGGASDPPEPARAGRALLLPLLGLLALDSWLTYQRAMSAAHVAFDRTLSSSLKSIREGVRLNDGEIEVDLPYLALEMLESSDGGKVYYLIREDNGHTITGYRTCRCRKGATQATARCSSRVTTSSIAASSCGWPRCASRCTTCRPRSRASCG